MIRRKRWTIAQNYEKEWWDIRKDQIDFDFYREYAKELLNYTQGIVQFESKTFILEIGSGAGGIITFLNSDHRHAIDPLEDYYSSIPNFKIQRDHKVIYQKAKAENVPYKNNQFDFVICDNVLDHCDDIGMIFKEINRVLASNGKVYLRLNIYSFWGKFIRLIVEALGIDAGHPHTFTKKLMSSYFKNDNFQIIKIERRSFIETWIKELRSRKVKELLKALSFSSPSKTMFLLEKSEDNESVIA
jgi:ubiquinone/menaquinone biosynthesis C-methylase UbiE